MCLLVYIFWSFSYFFWLVSVSLCFLVFQFFSCFLQFMSYNFLIISFIWIYSFRFFHHNKIEKLKSKKQNHQNYYVVFFSSKKSRVYFLLLQKTATHSNKQFISMVSSLISVDYPQILSFVGFGVHYFLIVDLTSPFMPFYIYATSLIKWNSPILTPEISNEANIRITWQLLGNK